MCLAIPMVITSIDGYSASCEARGVVREISLLMLQGDDQPGVGDFVLVHLGQATRKLSADEAAETWQLLDQILEAGAS